MNSLELEPWIVVLGEGPSQSLALWKLEANEQTALAVFSTQAAADRYALLHANQSASATQPDRLALLRIMIECFQRGIHYAVLDPDSSTARSIFDLRQVLRAARQLKSHDFE